MLHQPASGEDIYSEMVRRITDCCPVEHIILFGSRARGDADPHSDVDLMVLVPAGTDTRAAFTAIQLKLSGMGVAKDIVVSTTERFLRYANVVNTVQWHAAREGKTLYASAAVAVSVLAQRLAALGAEARTDWSDAWTDADLEDYTAEAMKRADAEEAEAAS